MEVITDPAEIPFEPTLLQTRDPLPDECSMTKALA
jgi:hypothetical protein